VKDVDMTNQQLSLFGDESKPRQRRPFSASEKDKFLDRFKGAVAFSAVGDALGWPTEFGFYPDAVQSSRNREFPLTEYVGWNKRLGGRWWGYVEQIRAGSYSDDTQLSLCIARCIDAQGSFDPAKFSYFELPLWLVYEQGGGSSVKFAARSFVSSRREWWHNFYTRRSTQNPLDYRNAGANGAAMRVLPIALVNAFNESKLFYESFISSIVTHGHPRAILSTMIYAGAVSFLLQHDVYNQNDFFDYIDYVINSSVAAVREWPFIDNWLLEWNRRSEHGKNFEKVFQDIRKEARDYLRVIPDYLSLNNEEYYKYVRALSKDYKGSGTSTVMVAIYLFAKFHHNPEKALSSAVNTLGSDTDTIANFVGGLLGAHYGLKVVPQRLLEDLQDYEYLLTTASHLYNITSGDLLSNQIVVDNFDRKDALLRILAWEVGLHEMFWEALGEGDRLTHPSLGAGVIIRKEIKPLLRDDYQVKLIGIDFDCGQTCTFHSRVSKSGAVAESLATELKRGLADEVLEF